MKRRLWIASVLVVLAPALAGLVGCASAPKTTPEHFEATVKSIWVKYSEYIKAGDADKWITLWDEGGVQLPPGTPMRVGTAAILEGIRAGFSAFKYESFDIQLSGTFVDHEYGFAYGNYTYTLVPKAGGAKIPGDGKYETIFKRQPDGSWKIFRDCFNSNVP